MATLGPREGTLRVYTKREGLGARVGHDLVLEARSWSAEANLDPDDVSRSSVTATVDGGSLDVVEGRGGAIPLSDKDRGDIRKNIAQKVLTRPEIRFQSTAVSAAGADRLALDGELTLNGTTRPARLELTRQAEGDREHLNGRLTITQTEFGIKPFSAMLGALKVSDKVDVEIDVRVPREAAVG